MKKELLKVIIFCLVLFTTNSSAQCWKSISAGSDHVLALKIDGSLWAWGVNTEGVLGDGTFVNKSSPTQIGTATDWSKIDTGAYKSFAIKTNGTLWAWGKNTEGELGNGTKISSNIPIQIGTDSNWIEVKSAYAHTLALKNDGTIWVWGRNYSFQLGNDTTLPSYIPIQVGVANDWAKIEASDLSSFAIKTNGTLWAWGGNGVGNLGNGTTTNIGIPTQIGTDTNWAKISTNGLTNTLAIKTNGTLWAWGNNLHGQIGNGTTEGVTLGSPSITAPVQIGTATNWAEVASDIHSLAIKTTGSLWAWGRNLDGSLGNGTEIDRYVPTAIGFATNWNKLSNNQKISYSIKSDGNLWAWGNNQSGRLGDGTTINRLSPVLIPCPTTLSNSDFNNAIKFSVYPNPANGLIKIESIEKEIKKIEIIDFLGKVVLIKNVNSTYSAIDISNLQNGIYLLKVYIENETKTFKIMKN